MAFSKDVVRMLLEQHGEALLANGGRKKRHADLYWDTRGHENQRELYGI